MVWQQVDNTTFGSQLSTHLDYSLEYSTDAEGNAVWYLYDKASDTYTPVADLEAAYQQVQNGETSSSSEGVSKVVVFILALIIAALVAIVFVLIYKLRDLVYYEDEEYDEDEDPGVLDGLHIGIVIGKG